MSCWVVESFFFFFLNIPNFYICQSLRINKGLSEWHLAICRWKIFCYFAGFLSLGWALIKQHDVTVFRLSVAAEVHLKDKMNADTLAGIHVVSTVLLK